ncbi:hypothetical protein K440DRAFT_662155 [Wilcoxina mikolae CBS 423.85]|nr:hypothetical protein K440DRAFT_662155 [Wilcoxina mikolae CBS 423.85]
MSSKSASLQDLRRQCKDLNLSTRGNNATLSKCLQDHAQASSGPSKEQEELECDAVLMTRSEVGDQEEMKEDAKSAFRKALDEEDLHVEEVRGKLFVGNRRGLNLAELMPRVRVLEEEVATQKEEIATQKEEIILLKIKVVSLEDRVSSLTMSLHAYKLLRNRFISTFKRDKLANATEVDRKIIASGNGWAHGGDAVVDAQLYKSETREGRRDFEAYEKLYGITPLIVLFITHKETIDVLNIHAGVISSSYKTGSNEFYARFNRFVEVFRESELDDSYLDGGSTDVTRAYWAFLNCIPDEVTRVDAMEG